MQKFTAKNRKVRSKDRKTGSRDRKLLRAENKALKIENAELKESKFKKLIPVQLKRAIQNKKGQAKKSERNVGGQVGTMAIIELK